MAPAYAIQTEELSKIYRAPRGVRDLLSHPLRPPEEVTALDRVTLEVFPGEVFGLLGPNGAGKTTLLKLLTCLVLPTSGSARVNGHSVLAEERAVKTSIGYVTSDERSFYWRLSGNENLRFFGRLQGLEGKALRRRCGELLEKVELSPEAAEERFMNYSSGMRQKLAIARALLHDPPVLFMDEPTRSLDPLTARHLRALVRDVLAGRDGKTVLLATHNLGEADEICSRVGILVRARLRRVGSPAELRRWVDGGEVYRLQVEGVGERALPAGSRVLEPGPRLRFEATLRGQDGLDGLLRDLHASGARIVACERVEATLEEVFDRICTSPEPETPQALSGAAS